MLCPRCGHEAEGLPACPRCGVVFAKLQARANGAPTTPIPKTPPRSGGIPARRLSAADEGHSLVRRLGLPVLVAGLLAAGLVGLSDDLFPPPPPPPRVASPPSTAVRVPAAGVASAALPASPMPASPPPALLEAPGPSVLDPAERDRAEILAKAVKARSPMGAREVAEALALLDRHPDDLGLRRLAEAVLVLAADAERAARRYPAAEDLLRRVLKVLPGSRPARMGLTSLFLETGDWSAAEAMARDLLAQGPDAFAYRGLGQALMRQDRNREAVEALEASLALADDPTAREMLAHVTKGLRDERGMTEKQLAHFNVRYDGGEHEDVGREILRALDRHHATLTTVFDHRPAAAIPVILFSQQDYYDAAGAPRWSGGVFNHFDGRIRIPIRGLTSSLSPDMDGVLVHEVTHAFIADLSRGVGPRDIQEGMAQYMEGKRIASALSAEQLRGLADGRVGGVSGFYFGALAFVEHLLGQRGQGGMNDLLRAMGETGDVDAAFRQVYGQDHATAMRAFQQRFRSQYGS